MKISLSILSADFANVEMSIKDLMNEVDYIHFDVMDGEFVPNITYGYSFVKDLRKMTKTKFDTHLMILHPQNYIKQFAEAGSDRITFHVEADCDVLSTVRLIQSFGIPAGISICPKTKVEEIEEVLPFVDLVMVMSVEPGFGGQKFLESSVEKVKRLYELRKEKGYSYEISIDGGINDETIQKVSKYLDIVVVGSYVCSHKNSLENLNKIKNI